MDSYERWKQANLLANFQHVSEQPLDLVESVTRRLAAHADELLAMGRDLAQLPLMTRDWSLGSSEGSVVQADIVAGPTAYIDTWLRYTDVLRPSPTIAMKASSAGFGTAPWEQIDLLARQAANVDIRMIIADEEHDEATTRALRHLASHGMRFRVAKEPPCTFFATADGTSSLPFEWGTEWPTRMLVLHDPVTADALHRWFESVWAHAVPYGTDPERWESVLELLDQGLDDEAIGARLGWSTRTVRRRISEAMDDLGVDNRFALGRAWALTRRA